MSHKVQNPDRSCCATLAGYLPPSLQAVNAEIQRRIDARDARLKQGDDKPEHSDEPMRISTPGPVEPPLTFNTHDSVAPVSLSSYEDVNPPSLTARDGAHRSVGFDNRDSAAAPVGTAWGQHYAVTQPPESFSSRGKNTDEMLPESNMHTSGSASSLESEASGQMETPQLAPHRPVGMTDAELVKLAELKAGSQQAQHAQQPAAYQTASNAAAAVPISVLAKAGSGKGAPSAEGKQRRKSKREKARGLLSSFTGG